MFNGFFEKLNSGWDLMGQSFNEMRKLLTFSPSDTIHEKLPPLETFGGFSKDNENLTADAKKLFSTEF